MPLQLIDFWINIFVPKFINIIFYDLLNFFINNVLLYKIYYILLKINKI